MSDDKKQTSSTSSTSAVVDRPTSSAERQWQCPICLLDIDADMDHQKFKHYWCCGSRLHNKCFATMASQMGTGCPFCRKARWVQKSHPYLLRYDANIEKLKHWVSKDKAWAKVVLGTQYLHGTRGVTKDVNRAFEYYMEAAEQGDANGQFNIGRMYQHGIGARRLDLRRALYYYKLAAAPRGTHNKGLARAQSALGYIYSGLLVNGKSGLIRAKYWWEKAAEQGNELAIKNLEILKKKESEIASGKEKEEPAPEEEPALPSLQQPEPSTEASSSNDAGGEEPASQLSSQTESSSSNGGGGKTKKRKRKPIKKTKKHRGKSPKKKKTKKHRGKSTKKKKTKKHRGKSPKKKKTKKHRRKRTRKRR